MKETSVNLKAPIVINSETRQGCQLIVEDDYPVKYKIYKNADTTKKRSGGLTYAGIDTKKRRIVNYQ